VHVAVAGHVRIGPRRPRPVRRRHYVIHTHAPTLHVGAAFVYRDFAEPPPPVVDCGDCSCDPAPAVVPATPLPDHCVLAPRLAPAPIARFALGVTGGRYEVDTGRDAGEVGLVARLRVAPALELELEAAKTEHDDGSRLDKRLGGALYVDLSPYALVSPYLVGGAGLARADAGTGPIEQKYGEVGAGLAWRVSDRFTLAGDLRLGKRVRDDRGDAKILPLAIYPTVPDEEDYSRGRLSAILYF
jgi:hypothetical protein